MLIFTFLNFSIPTEVPAGEIDWMKFEEAVTKNKTSKRYIFIDLYTDWCGWCKKMDASTFKDKDVVSYMNANFYSVKMDAEQKEDIQYKDQTYKFVKSGRNGIHQLAYALLDGKLSYPSFVVLDKQEKRVTILKGYMDKNALLAKLKAVVK
jgi:thioredoxin-related protein